VARLHCHVCKFVVTDGDGKILCSAFGSYQDIRQTLTRLYIKRLDECIWNEITLKELKAAKKIADEVIANRTRNRRMKRIKQSAQRAMANRGYRHPTRLGASRTRPK
jgi:hypothetical protein